MISRVDIMRLDQRWWSWEERVRRRGCRRSLVHVVLSFSRSRSCWTREGVTSVPISTLSTTDPPFYAMFFVIAGAELDVSRIPAMGMLGVVYIAGRATGKSVGARMAARRLALADNVRRFLGFALQAQAGLAVGLTLAVNSRHPPFAPVVSTVVLAPVAVFEMIGPASTRRALVHAGEAGRVGEKHGTDTLAAEL